MIILRLRGGLGNQLFQYAAGKSLALYHNTDLKLDLYYYKKNRARKLELDNFNIPIELASRDEVHQFTGSNPIIRYLNKRENYLRCPSVFSQPHYHFFSDFFSLPSNIYLSGYFQSEKYFNQIRSNLLSWYTPKKALDNANENLISEIKACESVALHVRRGDYAKGEYTSFFGTLSDGYYESSIRKIKEKIKNPIFFVFSDDIDWCRKNPLLENAVFISHNKGMDSHKDLILMSHCKHNIIANSTFSWWGAWLNQNPEKLVIAPEVWFRKKYYDGKTSVYPSRIYNTMDLIPQEWVRL